MAKIIMWYIQVFLFALPLSRLTVHLAIISLTLISLIASLTISTLSLQWLDVHILPFFFNKKIFINEPQHLSYIAQGWAIHALHDSDLGQVLLKRQKKKTCTHFGGKGTYREICRIMGHKSMKTTSGTGSFKLQPKWRPNIEEISCARRNQRRQE